MEDEDRLLQFLIPSNDLRTILLVECEEISNAITELMPNAKIYIIQKEKITLNKKNLLSGDFLGKHKDIEGKNIELDEKKFDYIICGDCIEKVVDSLKFLKVLYAYLKDTGSLVASFGNVCHWSVLKGLMNGQWRYRENGIIRKNVLHFFTVSEIVQLFEQAQYKEIKIGAEYKYPTDKFCEQLLDYGFNNKHDQMMVFRWLICADKIDKKEEFLRSCFTPDFREKLVFLLRRIENDINFVENMKEFYRLCIINKIEEYYIVMLIDGAMTKPEKVIIDIALYFYERASKKNSFELLKIGNQLYPGTVNLLFTWVSLLYLGNEKEQVLRILKDYRGIDPDVIALYEKVRAELC